MIEILTSAAERAAGQLTPENVEKAAFAVQQDGFCVLLGTTHLDHIDALYARMLHDRKTLDAAGQQLRELRGNQPMPREPEFLFPDIIQNPFVAQVLAAVMGPEPTCGLYSSNVSLPGCGEQVLHVDMAPRRAEDPVGGPCTCMVANTALVDFTLENGATEIWPGTHLLPPAIGNWHITDEEASERSRVAPPVRACVPRGGVFVRDIRLWHRGTSNHTDIVRPMVAQITNGGYLPGTSTPESIPSIGLYPESARTVFAAGPLHYNPTFTDEAIDFTQLPTR